MDTKAKSSRTSSYCRESAYSNPCADRQSADDGVAVYSKRITLYGDKRELIQRYIESLACVRQLAIQNSRNVYGGEWNEG